MSRLLLSLVCIVGLVTGASAATLEVYLPMDGNLNDYSGNNRNATIVEAVCSLDGTNYGTNAYAAGHDGVGQSLDIGTTEESIGFLESQYAKEGNDYVAIPQVAAMTNSGSIAMWYKTSSLHFNYECVWDNLAHYDRWESWIDNQPDTDGGTVDTEGPRMFVRASENSFNSDPLLRDHQMTQIFALPLDTWIHVAATWQRSVDTTTCDLNMYINGELVDTATNIPWELDPGQFCLGGGHARNNPTLGAYDDVRLYSGVLSAQEVANLVPEPGSLVLLLVGGLATALFFRRRNG